jgi:hypothetical protein
MSPPITACLAESVAAPPRPDTGQHAAIMAMLEYEKGPDV